MMQISSQRYSLDRQRHDLTLRMIRHEVRTHTIHLCTGLSEARIRKLYDAYAYRLSNPPPRRQRGKSPRRAAYFTRNVRTQLESSVLASLFITFGLLDRKPSDRDMLELCRLLCDAYDTHLQLLGATQISLEHAWFLLQLLHTKQDLYVSRCRHCRGQYVRTRIGRIGHGCPACKLKHAKLAAKGSRPSTRGGGAAMPQPAA